MILTIRGVWRSLFFPFSDANEDDNFKVCMSFETNKIVRCYRVVHGQSVYDDSSCYVYLYQSVCCVQALTLDSRSVEALSLKGLALMEVKKTPEALSHFREALRLAPHRFEAYNSTCLSLTGVFGQPFVKRFALCYRTIDLLRDVCCVIGV